jgi:hypothetical protein
MTGLFYFDVEPVSGNTKQNHGFPALLAHYGKKRVAFN